MLQPIPAAAQAPARGLPERLGRILEIHPLNIGRVLAVQREQGLRFGEAACALGFATQADVERALAHQAARTRLRPAAGAPSREVIAAYEPSSSQVEALRAVRNQLVLRWLERDPESRALAILSAARRDGRSFIAANLAVLFSQLGHRTLLVDADLRNPRQHQLFGLDNRIGLSQLLSDRADAEAAVQSIAALPHLSLLPAGATAAAAPQDLVARPAFARHLEALRAQFDLLLLDCPSAGEGTEAQTIAVRAGAALVVVRNHSSRVWHVQGVSQDVAGAQSNIVGAVLNEV
jgi:receptor protein-tyrosine kinase